MARRRHHRPLRPGQGDSLLQRLGAGTYPNRVTNGQYSFDGEDYQMPIDEFDRQSSLHGYAYRYMWELEDLQESHVTLSWRSPDIAGYPFDITITATYALDENGLTETFTVHNNDA